MLPAEPIPHNQQSTPAVAATNTVAANKKRDKKGNLVTKEIKHYKEQVSLCSHRDTTSIDIDREVARSRSRELINNLLLRFRLSMNSYTSRSSNPF
jgi:hypothetical protein